MAKLSCTVNNGKNTVCWVQQKSGQSPRNIQCAGNSRRGDGVPDRFTATDSGDVGSLTIMNTQPEDEADYYCYMWYSRGVSSLPSWVQPPSESVSLGQTAKLSCTVSGTQYDIHWYQQRGGQIPRYVHYAGGSRGEGIPDRFTASVSGNIGYLTILNVQAEDEGDYYCGMWYDSSNWKYHCGEV
ncbi:UNVERIFIED_CONTAM: hypothetical protein K2H54_021816 [Gekko kuhli]